MGISDSSLPQTIYADSDVSGRHCWCHCQILADHFWANIKPYLRLVANLIQMSDVRDDPDYTSKEHLWSKSVVFLFVTIVMKLKNLKFV